MEEISEVSSDNGDDIISYKTPVNVEEQLYAKIYSDETHYSVDDVAVTLRIKNDTNTNHCFLAVNLGKSERWASHIYEDLPVGEDINLTFSKLNIKNNGTYTLDVVFEDTNGGGEISLAKKPVTLKLLSPGYAKANIKYNNQLGGNSPLINLDIAKDLINDANRVLVYVDNEVLFNKTLVYRNNDNEECILRNIFSDDVGLDKGKYSAEVYLVNDADGTQKEIGSGNFTISVNEIDGDVGLWINIQDLFPLSNEGLYNIFATVTVPEGTTANVTFTKEDKVLYNKALVDFDSDRIEGNKYAISLEEYGSFIFEDLKGEDVFKFAVLDKNGEVNSREYRIFFENGFVRFEELYEDGENDWSIVNQNEIIINPDNENYDPDAVVATIKDQSVRKINIALEHIGGGEVGIFYATVGEIPDEGYEIRLKDLNLDSVGDKNIITLICFDENGNVIEDYIVVCAVKRTDDFIQFFEIGDVMTLSFQSFYGNLITGDLNDPDIMGWHPEGTYIQVCNHHELDEVTVTVDGGNYKKTYTLNDMIDETNPDGYYDYSMGAYAYSIMLSDEIKNELPENEVLTFNFICGDANVTQKRIRHGDYMYKIITPDDVSLLFNVTIADGQLNDLNDAAVNIKATLGANRQSIFMDFGGGFFTVYVKDVKVEDLGRLVRIDGETELELFRLCGHEDAWPDLNITLNDLGITAEGIYNIKVNLMPGPEEFIEAIESEVISKDVKYSTTPELIDLGLAIDVADINYGEDVLVVATANNTFSGNVSVQIENGIYAIILNDGVGNTTVSNLNAGTYDAIAVFNGNDIFNACEANDTFTVNKVDSTLEVPSITFNCSDLGASEASFTGATGIVAVVNDLNAVVEVKGNIITVSNLTEGNYRLTVTTVPDINHNEVTVTVNVTVSKIGTVISASEKVTTTYGSAKNIVVTLKDELGIPLIEKEVTITLNGKQYSGTTDLNGQVSIAAVTKTLPVKSSYDAKIEFAGDIIHAKSSKTVKVVVNKAKPKLTAKSKTFKKSVKTKKYALTLKTDKNAALKNAKVTIKVNKVTYTAHTNSQGKATLKITKLNKKGKFAATVKFVGNAKYKALSKKVTITVK